eukprot:CAMPEP_0185748052 /NCGR_PEP_ID=MMETSP1174-20130828/6700_1 /TAXON_ID=35687 /ORGANISM="Dictyocha speculum, Strain CCMP1381" /LENGTH=491 /DNA_ID=CAMNT_0028423529 /DNA_START=66 /DNA_END=1539 /DNA_ORIENTATION=+
MGLVNAFTEAVAGEDSGVDESTAFAFLSRFGFRSVDDFGYEETEVNFQKFVAEMERFDGHISLRAILQVASNFVEWLSERGIFMEDLVKDTAFSRLGFHSFSRASDFTAFAFLSRLGFQSVLDFGYGDTKRYFQEFLAEMGRFDERISTFQVTYAFVEWLAERDIFVEDLMNLGQASSLDGEEERECNKKNESSAADVTEVHQEALSKSILDMIDEKMTARDEKMDKKLDSIISHVRDLERPSVAVKEAEKVLRVQQKQYNKSCESSNHPRSPSGRRSFSVTDKKREGSSPPLRRRAVENGELGRYSSHSRLQEKALASQTAHCTQQYATPTWSQLSPGNGAKPDAVKAISAKDGYPPTSAGRHNVLQAACGAKEGRRNVRQATCGATGGGRTVRQTTRSVKESLSPKKDSDGINDTPGSSQEMGKLSQEMSNVNGSPSRELGIINGSCQEMGKPSQGILTGYPSISDFSSQEMGKPSQEMGNISESSSNK